MVEGEICNRCGMHYLDERHCRKEDLERIPPPEVIEFPAPPKRRPMTEEESLKLFPRRKKELKEA